jgi:hypothetical protein
MAEMSEENKNIVVAVKPPPLKHSYQLTIHNEKLSFCNHLSYPFSVLWSLSFIDRLIIQKTKTAIDVEGWSFQWIGLPGHSTTWMIALEGILLDLCYCSLLLRGYQKRY